jgi:hypothetical protein
MSEKFVKCQCWAHAVEVATDDNEISMCFWSIGHDPDHRKSLKERIRWAWHDLIGKPVWTDECCLTPESARQLANYLNDAAKEAEEYVAEQRNTR